MARPKKAGNLCNKAPSADWDDLDLQIFECLCDNPTFSYHQIAGECGVATSTICRRVAKWRNAEWFDEIASDLMARATANYRRRLRRDDVRADSAAHDILFGRGVFSSKHDHNVRGSLVLDEDSVVDFLCNCDTQTYIRICQRANAAAAREPDA